MLTSVFCLLSSVFRFLVGGRRSFPMTEGAGAEGGFTIKPASFPGSQFEIHGWRVLGLSGQRGKSLLQESENGLRQRISLRQHGRAGLHQDVVPGVLSGFSDASRRATQTKQPGLAR